MDERLSRTEEEQTELTTGGRAKDFVRRCWNSLTGGVVQRPEVEVEADRMGEGLPTPLMRAFMERYCSVTDPADNFEGATEGQPAVIEGQVVRVEDEELLSPKVEQ